MVAEMALAGIQSRKRGYKPTRDRIGTAKEFAQNLEAVHLGAVPAVRPDHGPAFRCVHPDRSRRLLHRLRSVGRRADLPHHPCQATAADPA